MISFEEDYVQETHKATLFRTLTPIPMTENHITAELSLQSR